MKNRDYTFAIEAAAACLSKSLPVLLLIVSEPLFLPESVWLLINLVFQEAKCMEIWLPIAKARDILIRVAKALMSLYEALVEWENIG